MLRNPRLITRPYAVREALASARIEGTQASLADVFQAEAAHQSISVNDAAEVSVHIAALDRGLEDVRTNGLSLRTLCRTHRRLTHEGAQQPAGNLRRTPVWLGSPTARPETAVFVPPVGQAMSDSLQDWEEFLRHPPRIPLLMRAALLHFQFLTIHPFVDGNGRVGRILVQLILEHERRLNAPLLYVSAYFADHRREYYDRLQAVRERGEMQEWLQFFLTAVAAQAEDGVVRAERLLNLREQYRVELSGGRSRAAEVVELLFENPVTTTSIVRDKLGVTTQGALNLIRSLETRGWLEPLGNFGRGGARYWMAGEILRLLTSPARETE
jgi:Fic family protein